MCNHWHIYFGDHHLVGRGGPLDARPYYTYIFFAAGETSIESWWSPYFAREIPPDLFHPIQGGSEFPWPPALIPSTWASLWVSCFMKRWGRPCRLHARGRRKKRGAVWRIIPDLLREMIGFQQQKRDVNGSKWVFHQLGSHEWKRKV